LVERRIVPLERLTEESFQSCGYVIKGEEEIPIEMDGIPSISILEVKRRPFEFCEMARHRRTMQAFVPLGGQPWALAVAPPEGIHNPATLPDVGRIRAFLIPGDRGVMIRRGTWHYGPLHFEEKAYFVNIEEKGTNENDFDLKSIERALGVMIAIDLNI